jgi:hypothetical protein
MSATNRGDGPGPSMDATVKALIPLACVDVSERLPGRVPGRNRRRASPSAIQNAGKVAGPDGRSSRPLIRVGGTGYYSRVCPRARASVALDVCFRQNRPQERWRGRSDLTRCRLGRVEIQHCTSPPDQLDLLACRWHSESVGDHPPV